MRVHLSNPQGAVIPEKHQRAMGVITNDGPLPKAWLAEFTHSVGTEVVDGIIDRMGSRSGNGLWHRASQAQIDGSDVRGKNTGALVGYDEGTDQLVMGLAIAGFKADGQFTKGENSYDLRGQMIGTFPYLQYQPYARLGFWGMMGYGNGDLTIITKDYRQDT